MRKKYEMRNLMMMKKITKKYITKEYVMCWFD